VDAEDQSGIEQFMAPFGQVGTVEILPASRCEAVGGPSSLLARGGDPHDGG
jgi:hypothetical protein